MRWDDIPGKVVKFIGWMPVTQIDILILSNEHLCKFPSSKRSKKMAKLIIFLGIGNPNFLCNHQCILLLILCGLWSASTACPSGCTCNVDAVGDLDDDSYRYENDYNYIYGVSSEPQRGARAVYCVNKGLTAPIDSSSVPPDTYYLDFSGNNIKVLRSRVFSSLAFLQILNLSGSSIEHIESRAFDGLDTLEKLDLSRNKLRSVNNSMFQGLGSVKELNISHNQIATISSSSFERLQSLKKIDFQSSILMCDCKLKWIVKWERDNGVRIMDSTVCAFPEKLQNKRVHVLKKGDLGCNHGLELPIFTLLPSGDQVVFIGDTIPFVCKATLVDESLSITWWKNNHPIEEGPEAVVTHRRHQEERLATSTLTLSIGVESSSEFWKVECKISSSTGTLKKGVMLRILDGSTSYCLPSTTTDNKGIFEWPGLVGGASAEVSCPEGASYIYTGPEGSAMARRLCNSDGKWEDPRTGECAFTNPTLRDLERYSVMNILNNTAALLIAKKVEIAVSDAAVIKDPTAVFFIGRFMERFSEYPGQEVGRAMLNIASSMMEVDESVLAQSQVEDRSCSKIVLALEKFAADVLTDKVQVFHYEAPNLAMQAHRVTPEGFVGMTCASFVRELGKRDEYDEQHFKCNGRNITSSKLNNNHSVIEAAIQLPASIFWQAASHAYLLEAYKLLQSRDFKLQFLVYKNAKLFPIQQDGLSKKKVVESSVISSKIDKFPFTNLTDNVVLTFKHSTPRRSFNQLSPGFWDFNAKNSLGAWKSKGCNLTEVKDDIAVLKCNHLTNFALLKTVDMDESAPPGGLFSEYLLHPSIYITTFIFTLLILLVLISYICCYRSIRVKAKAKHSLVNICVCLLVLSVTFAGGINRTYPVIACKAVGMALHYFSTCCLLWLAIAARNLMKALSKSDQPQLAPGETPPPPRPIIRFYFVGWGIPMIIVGITAAASSDLGNYGGQEFCWISEFTISMASFFSVAALVSLATCLFFIITTRRININGTTHHGRSQMYEIPTSAPPPSHQITAVPLTDQFGSSVTMNSHHPPASHLHSNSNLQVTPQLHSDAHLGHHLNMNSNANPSRQSQESLSSVSSWLLDQEKPHAKQLHSLVFLFLGFMGLWTLGAMIVIQKDTLSTIFIYLYSGVLVVYGLFIFINHCALRNDVLIRWKKLCGCSQREAYTVSVPTDPSQHSQVNGHVMQRRPSASSVDSGLTNRSNNTNHSNPSFRSGSRLTSHCNYMPTNLHTGTDASIDSSTQDTLPRSFMGDKRNGYGHRYNKSRNRSKNPRYSRHSRQSRDFSDGGALPESALGHPPSSSGPSTVSHRSQRNEFLTAVVVGDARNKLETADNSHISDGSQSGRQPPSSISKSLDQLRNNSHAESMSSVEQAGISKPKYRSSHSGRSSPRKASKPKNGSRSNGQSELPSPLPEEEPLMKPVVKEITPPPSYEDVTECNKLLPGPDSPVSDIDGGATLGANNCNSLTESGPAVSLLSLNSEKKETSV